MWQDVNRSFNTAWRVVEGELSSDEFATQALAAADSGGLAFDLRRWFYQDDELIHSGGRTYAFTKMWGSKTEIVMRQLLEKFPEADIRVERSDS